MKKVLGFLILGIILISTYSLAAYPADLEEQELQAIRQQENVEVTSSDINEDEIMLISESNEEIVNDDLYEADDNVTVSKEINGNVYVMGENVKFDGARVYGNVYAMGKSVEINESQVDGSIYVLGEDVKFIGMSSNDIYVCGSKISFDENSFIWRSMRVTCESFEMNGTVGRDIFAGVNNLVIGDTGNVKGTLNYVSENEGNISQLAKIASVNYQNEKITENMKEDKQNEISSYIYDLVSFIIKTLIVSLIFVFCISKFNKLKRTENVAIDLLKNTGIGFGVLFLVPILSILIMCTGIGLGIGVALIAIYTIAVYIATSVLSLEIAQRVLMKADNKEITNSKLIGLSVLIAVIIWFIELIPIAGVIVKILSKLIGLGIIFNLIFQKSKKEEVNEN